MTQLRSLLHKIGAPLCLCGLLILSGCTFISTGDSQNKDVEYLISTNQYRAAKNLLTVERDKQLTNLEKINAKRASLDEADQEKANKLLESIQATEGLISSLDKQLAGLPEKSSTYQTKILSELAQLKKQGEWQEADRQLYLLEGNILDPEALKQYRVEFNAQRQKVVTRLEYDLLMLESSQLPARVELYRALAQAGYGDAAIYSRLRSEEDQKKRVVSSLRERAKLAEQQGKLQTSLRLLQALAKLDNSEAVSADVRRMKNWLASKNKKRVDDKKNQFENEYNIAVTAKDWIKARVLLDTQLKRQPNSKDLQAKDSYLEDVYAEQLSQAKLAGEQHYTEGDIETALELWQGALVYAPDDVDLLTNVQRAQKILNKLETLKNSTAVAQ